MKQLIPQEKIDEAAKEASTINKDNYPAWEILFKQGVQFALNEIQPLMVEFVDYCSDLYSRNRDNTWGAMSKKSTQQLLEEFIKYKEECTTQLHIEEQ